MFGVGHVGRQSVVGRRGVSGATLDLSFMTPGTLPSGVVFTRASTATYFDASGTMQTAAINTPRWDYNPTSHVLNGLLIEEARTNLLLNSATLSTQSITTTAVATTLSFYGTGTVTLSGSATGSLVGTGSQRASMTFTPTAGSLTCTVTGTVTNAQIEAGGFVTSWIPTTAASVARAADAASMPTSPWLTNPLALSCAVEAISTGVATPGSVHAQFDDGTQPNRLNILTTTAGNSVQYNDVVGGVVTTTQGAAYILGTTFKAAFSTVSGLHQFSLNGSAPSSNVSAANPPAVTTLRFGKAVTPTVGALYLRRVRYWPRALSNAELQSVTT